MASLFDFRQTTDGRPALRYDGVIAGAYGQLICDGCQRQLYKGRAKTRLSRAQQNAKAALSMKYRKKPVVIDAFQLGIDYIPDWFMDKVSANEVILHGKSSGFVHFADTNADIKTLEGWHHANYGDYIIRGVKGEIYPCKPDIFAMTYEEVSE